MRIAGLVALAFLAFASAGQAQEAVTVEAHDLIEWKSVHGRVEARDRIPARARIGGTLAALEVSEGDAVQAGQVLARVADAKLDFRLGAIDAGLEALASQLANAEAELARGEELLARGVTTAQRLDALRTQVEVLANQIAAQRAERRVVEEQAAEGAVLAPAAGRVLTVPVAEGAVVMPGEAVATIGGGGFFLRLAVPERHAASLAEGAALSIGLDAGAVEGRLAKLYPQIENGRVIADVEVAGLDAGFVDARVPVRLPVGLRRAVLVPETALRTRAGLDFVALAGDPPVERLVVPGPRHEIGGRAMVEIVTGLAPGETVLAGAPRDE